MAFDPARAARGALAGAAAAGLWAVQQPLDRRLFGVDYDDTELLGKLVTRSRAWPAAGLAMHLANGAVFGAVYATVQRRLTLPTWARGPALALGEHLVSWPFVAVTDRRHPAREDLPALGTSGRAFALATWRHLLFGFVLGEVERRLNAADGDDLLAYQQAASSNGHGNIEHAVIGVDS
jgi:hypothetical protein